MQKYNVVLYKDGVYHSKMSFGMSRNKSTYSFRYAQELAKEVRADKKFVEYEVRVEPTGI